MIQHRMLRGNTSCHPVYHPTVANRVFAVHGGANEIRVSDDAGVTWLQLDSLAYWSNIDPDAAKMRRVSDPAALMARTINTDNSLIYNTPALKDGLLYGISTTNVLFCVKEDNGETAWSAPLSGQGSQPPPAAPPPGKGGKGGRGGGGGNAGYGSVVDAGSVLVALTPEARVVVFQPSGSEFKQVASYKVADEGTFAYPVLTGNRIYIKDKDAVTLWTLE